MGGTQGRSWQVCKISPPKGSDHRAGQPVASRYTDLVIPDHNTAVIISNFAQMSILTTQSFSKIRFNIILSTTPRSTKFY
jgi:hypothetical protein